jgi:UDP-glucose 4-epimerase
MSVRWTCLFDHVNVVFDDRRTRITSLVPVATATCEKSTPGGAHCPTPSSCDARAHRDRLGGTISSRALTAVQRCGNNVAAPNRISVKTIGRGPENRMNYKRALITGGAGLIGSHIADRLVAEGCEEIVVLDNLTRGRRENLDAANASGKVTMVDGDIRDIDLVRRSMEGIDIVFHEAAIRITHCAENPRLAHDVLATGTFNVIEAAVSAGVKRVVSASSASIYGQAEKFPTSEKHHGYGNRTIYGATKMYSEGLLRSFHEMYGLNYVALRYFNVYGPRMDAFGVYTEVMIRWMERLAKDQPCVIFGDGAQTMDFVFVTDIARANLRAANSSITDDVLNIASGNETSLAELAAMLGLVMGVNRPVEYGPARNATPVWRRLADVKKAERLIGFKAEVSLEEGLRQLVQWWSRETQTPVKGLASSGT